MKKIVIVVLFFSCGNQPAKVSNSDTGSPTSANENYIQDSLNVVDRNGLRQGHWEIFGNMRPDLTDYPPDAKVEEGTYRNSLNVGLWFSYYPDGTKSSETNYVNGKADGLQYEYSDAPISKLISIKKFKEGEYVGDSALPKHANK